MSSRYYIGAAIFIGGLTFAISYWKKKQTGKEIFNVFLKVLIAMGVIIGAVLSIAWLLAYFEIAQSGFLL
tara:strand:+ start:1200 stop:1409 length:210 start_codon:yes stop_codon:yes gene_type:complete